MFKEASTRSASGVLHSAPAERNTAPIIAVLERALPVRGTVLEVASGTGQHIMAFAARFPELQWQPSDVDPELRASVEQRIADSSPANVAVPVTLDAAQQPWPVRHADAVICINMIHIAPWAATEGLFAGASGIVPSGGTVVTYGPYKRNGAHTAPSNAAFDASLRKRNPAWGVRDLDDVVAVAAAHGFTLDELVAMPANNFSAIFRAR